MPGCGLARVKWGASVNDEKGLSPEQQYYEDDRIWATDFEADSDEAARFSLIQETIPDDTRSLVDVGCGNGDFLKRIAGNYERVCGVDRSAAALRHVITEKYLASAADLPFGDREFDTVCCLEVIEHLPVAIFPNVLRELARVAAKHIVISVPYDEDTRADLVTCPSCYCSFNRNYHLRRFDEHAFRRLFDNVDGEFRVQVVNTVGEAVHPVGLATVKRLISPLRRPRLPEGAVCPQCGTSAKSGQIQAESMHRISTDASGTFGARRFLPKVRKPRWIVGHFVRDTE